MSENYACPIYMCPIEKVNLGLKENRTKLVAENLHLEKELKAREEEIASLKRDIEMHKDGLALVREKNKWLRKEEECLRKIIAEITAE